MCVCVCSVHHTPQFALCDNTPDTDTETGEHTIYIHIYISLVVVRLSLFVECCCSQSAQEQRALFGWQNIPPADFEEWARPGMPTPAISPINSFRHPIVDTDTHSHTTTSFRNVIIILLMLKVWTSNTNVGCVKLTGRFVVLHNYDDDDGNRLQPKRDVRQYNKIGPSSLLRPLLRTPKTHDIVYAPCKCSIRPNKQTIA